MFQSDMEQMGKMVEDIIQMAVTLAKHAGAAKKGLTEGVQKLREMAQQLAQIVQGNSTSGSR